MSYFVKFLGTVTLILGGVILTFLAIVGAISMSMTPIGLIFLGLTGVMFTLNTILYSVPNLC